MTESVDDAIPPFTVEELIGRIDGAWAEGERTIAGLTDEQLAAAAAGEWAIKDHLAHLTTWVRSAIGILTKGSRPEAMGISESVWATGSEDEINAEIAALWADRPAAEILIAFRAAQDELRTILGGMTRDDLIRPYADYQPDDREPNADPVVGWVMGNTFGHVEMHLPAIHALRPAPSRWTHGRGLTDARGGSSGVDFHENGRYFHRMRFVHPLR